MYQSQKWQSWNFYSGLYDCDSEAPDFKKKSSPDF